MAATFTHRMSTMILAACAACTLLAPSTPARAQGNPYAFPVGGSNQDLLQWYGGFQKWVAQMKDLSSLGIPNGALGGTGLSGLGGSGLGTTGTILNSARSLSRHVGRLTDLSTLGNPAAEAEVNAIVRRYQALNGLNQAIAADQAARTSAYQHQLKVYYANVASQALQGYYGSLSEVEAYVRQGNYGAAQAAAERARAYIQGYNQYRAR